LEVPTIYKAYIRPKFQGISPRNTCFWPDFVCIPIFHGYPRSR
jgi:hypothetical protein